MTKKIIIRKAAKKDLKEVAVIFKTEFGRSPYNEPWKIETLKRKIDNYFKNGEIFVALVEDKIVGMLICKKEIWYDGDWIKLHEVAVIKEFQKHGIGSHLIKALENYCKDNKVTRIYLEAASKNSFSFFKKRGYKKMNWQLMEKKVK